MFLSLHLQALMVEAPVLVYLEAAKTSGIKSYDAPRMDTAIAQVEHKGSLASS